MNGFISFFFFTACGLRPAHSARVARSFALNLPEGKFGAVHGQWPWHVALFKNGEYACDATLISDDWILTSTTCFESDPHAVWTARIGIIRLSSKSPFDQESRITGMVKSPIGSGVLSILKLEQSINGSDYVRPSCLPSHNYSLAGIPCNTLRWSVRIAFPARPRHALLAKYLVTWQAMVGRHILEDIVGRVTQYVDEHYPVDKWHLGDLIAWVAQSALKYRPRICELSKCLKGPLKMIVCPKKLLPTLSHLVKLLYAARQ
ncbi:atrial natriuretic peptide-converting enzyme [Trichonephila clavipes]|nr:atrial natriuretic peptide-converting enzyme [Trichonephila clavipes]